MSSGNLSPRLLNDRCWSILANRDYDMSNRYKLVCLSMLGAFTLGLNKNTPLVYSHDSCGLGL